MAAPTRVTHHHVVGTPTSTAAMPTWSRMRRRFCGPRPSTRGPVLSSVVAKWVLHTMIEWVSTPRAIMCTMSQVDPGARGWTAAVTTAATIQKMPGRSRMTQ